MLPKIYVKLSRPINSGGNFVSEVELKEPLAGELRGLKLAELLQLDTSAMVTLIPRISNLSARDMENVSAADLVKLMTETLSFFVDVTDSQTA